MFSRRWMVAVAPDNIDLVVFGIFLRFYNVHEHTCLKVNSDSSIVAVVLAYCFVGSSLQQIDPSRAMSVPQYSRQRKLVKIAEERRLSTACWCWWCFKRTVYFKFVCSVFMFHEYRMNPQVNAIISDRRETYVNSGKSNEQWKRLISFYIVYSLHSHIFK